jgi:acetyl esterase/lipase
MTVMMKLVVMAAVTVAVGCSSTSAHLAPGLYGDHAPRGFVSPNNMLMVPAHPRGVVMLVHGGSWGIVGKLGMDQAAPAARWLLARGYIVYDADYRAWSNSPVDVVAAYDHLRSLFGLNTEICAYGQSAGGMLVELLAASRPSVSCVISEAGIQDLRSLPDQCAFGGWCGALAPAATRAFGGRLWQFSPTRIARYITQPLLAGGSSVDPLIDERAQLAEIKSARAATHVMLLAGVQQTNHWAPTNFMHASVTAAALAEWRTTVLRLLAVAN